MWLKKYKKDQTFIMVKRTLSNLYVIQSRHANLKDSHADKNYKVNGKYKEIGMYKDL